MQFTFEYGEIIGLSSEERRIIDDLMIRYCSAKRIAFNKLLPLNGPSVKEVTHHLEEFDNSLALNWRYCEHAARDAHAEAKSQRELLPLYLSDTYDEIEEIKEKLANSKNSPKSLERKLRRLTKRREILEEHIAEGTIPKVIFGTRRLFIERAEEKITNKQWKDARNNQVYSIGQANQKGNANIRIKEDSIGINFPERIEQRVAKGGRVYRVKEVRGWFNLRVNEKFKWYMDGLLKSGRAYSARVVSRSGRYLVQVSFEISLPELESIPERACSIDRNPEGFAAAIVSEDGNLIAHRFFRDDRLIYASEEKREAIIGELVNEIIKWAGRYEVKAFVIEDLEIRNHKSFGKKGNRVIYAFVRKKFSENLMIRCWKKGYPVVMVNPAYTSRIGEAKYQSKYGLSVHEAAALCIGRRFYGFGEWIEEPVLITVKKDGKRRTRMPVLYVWASVYGYHHSADHPCKEPPGRKGSMDPSLGDGNEAVFTGHPASAMTPPSESREEVRKGGECGESPQATGNGVKPALSGDELDGGKVIATSLRINQSMIRNDMQETNPKGHVTNI